MEESAASRVQIKQKSSVGIGGYRARMTLLMLGADALGFAASGALVYLVNGYLRISVLDMGDLKYTVILVVCLVLFTKGRLYPGVGISPVTEIKLVTQYVSTGFAVGLVLLAIIQSRWTPNHFIYLLTWTVSVFMVLLARWNVRFLSAKLGLWGEPVVVIGRGAQVSRTIRYFMLRKRLGFIPVLAAIDTVNDKSVPCPVPVVPIKILLTSGVERFSTVGIKTALIDAPDISEFFRSDESKTLFHLFRRLILVSDLDWIEGASMAIQDYEGLIGIAAEKSVLTPIDAFLKRTLDITLSFVGGVAVLPVMLAAAIWIKLDSPGSLFYIQERLGKDRRCAKRPGEHWRKIKVYKFRTMFKNAEGALKAYLRSNPEARREWKANQKLCNDPRVTRAGRLLRMFSIDELPQLLNVLKGEMSLVGPRPMTTDQLKLYGDNIEAYCEVRPGLTGLWQVSGRNGTTFEERARFDIYYIRNWSVWLDFYILMRTVWVVLHRDGAY